MCCWVLMFKSLNFLGPSNFPILSINSFCRTQGTIPWQLQAHPGRSSREASVNLWRHWSISASTASSMMVFLWMILFPCSLASQIPRSAPSVILVPWLVSTCTTQWAFLRLMRWRMLFFYSEFSFSPASMLSRTCCFYPTAPSCFPLVDIGKGQTTIMTPSFHIFSEHTPGNRLVHKRRSEKLEGRATPG